MENDVVRSQKLILLGYWAGPYAPKDLPDVRDFVDHTWDTDEREFVGDYVRDAMIANLYMGMSLCRFCGQENGYADLTDGTYVWPSGLSHYVTEHGVRLPDTFVQHALQFSEHLAIAQRERAWWLAEGSARRVLQECAEAPGTAKPHREQLAEDETMPGARTQGVRSPEEGTGGNHRVAVAAQTHNRNRRDSAT